MSIATTPSVLESIQKWQDNDTQHKILAKSIDDLRATVATNADTVTQDKAEVNKRIDTLNQAWNDFQTKYVSDYTQFTRGVDKTVELITGNVDDLAALEKVNADAINRLTLDYNAFKNTLSPDKLDAVATALETLKTANTSQMSDIASALTAQAAQDAEKLSAVANNALSVASDAKSAAQAVDNKYAAALDTQNSKIQEFSTQMTTRLNNYQAQTDESITKNFAAQNADIEAFKTCTNAALKQEADARKTADCTLQANIDGLAKKTADWQDKEEASDKVFADKLSAAQKTIQDNADKEASDVANLQAHIDENNRQINDVRNIATSAQATANSLYGTVQQALATANQALAETQQNTADVNAAKADITSIKAEVKALQRAQGFYPYAQNNIEWRNDRFNAVQWVNDCFAVTPKKGPGNGQLDITALLDGYSPVGEKITAGTVIATVAENGKSDQQTFTLLFVSDNAIVQTNTLTVKTFQGGAPTYANGTIHILASSPQTNG